MAKYQAPNHRKLGWTLGILVLIAGGVFLYTRNMAPAPTAEPARAGAPRTVPEQTSGQRLDGPV